MTQIFAVTNQKGGVGKTTTCINLAASLVATKRKVLLVDMDPQGHATLGSGVDKKSLQHSLYDVLLGEVEASAARLTTDPAGYDLLPANVDLAGAEIALIDQPQRERRLSQALASIEAQYDFILIDCPPSLNLLTLNALTAARGVLVPVQCEFYALEGLASLMETLERVAQSVNPGLQIAGILRTMYDPRNSLTKDVSAQLIEHFEQRVLGTVIPRNIRLAEAPSYGLPVLSYDPKSKGSLAYLALAGELLRKSAKAS
ncbi:ParA family protein [Marinospirillum sp.]|uniref:ParA family protein n=1 Tax=Marinospirillum sp. TaxID=2183934 RepID=UPI003A892EDD